MKKAKQKPTVAPPLEKSLLVDEKPSSATTNNHITSLGNPTLPVGFYDDALADAKARNVDLKDLAEKRLESEWEAFQHFAAEVEQQASTEEKKQQEERQEREAIERLENMEYVDRYRVALERVTSLRCDGTIRKTLKRRLETEGSQDGEVEDVSMVQTMLSEIKRNKRSRKHAVDRHGAETEVDVCDWRSRGI